MFLKTIFTLLCYIATTFATINYEGYKIYDIHAKNKFEKGILLRLSANDSYDFFTLPRLINSPARALIPPKDQKYFEDTLRKFDIKHNVIYSDIDESIAKERQQNALMRSINGDSKMHRLFSRFLRFDEINAYIDELAKNYPQYVTVTTVGKSYEKREIKMIRIRNNEESRNKKVILIDAGIHAREWIAPASAVYIIHELVENYDSNTDLFSNYEWVILPVINPDGYEYTHTTARMWRKTRQPVTKSCIGTDVNRNFDFHWGEVGASASSCAETFRGKKAFSEPETKILRDVMLSLNGRAKMYITLHSYGNFLLYPWGYTSVLPETWMEIDEIAKVGARAIYKATKTVYTVGSSTNVLYAAAGGSDDYALAKAEIPIALTMELPAGGSGFNPSPMQIRPFVEETWIGIRAMAEKVIAEY